jgi:Protein of unknown function (DUF2867)
VKIPEAEFLKAHRESWTARRAAEFSVRNIHMAEISAPAARIFPELGRPGLLTPGWKWKLLLGLRLAIGKMFGWDEGLKTHPGEPLQPGKHYGFFLIEHADPPREVGMSVENRLTRAILCWVLDPAPGGTRVFNGTLANFKGRRGQFYWRVIERFHDGITEAALAELSRRSRAR